MYAFQNNRLKKVSYDTNTIRNLIFDEDYMRIKFSGNLFFGELRCQTVLYREKDDDKMLDEMIHYFDRIYLEKGNKMSISQDIRINLPPNFSKKLRKKIKENFW